MRSKINIAVKGEGHQALVYETENQEQVNDVVQTLTQKYSDKFIIFGQELGTTEAVQIQKKQIRDFVMSDKYSEKAVLQPHGGG